MGCGKPSKMGQKSGQGGLPTLLSTTSPSAGAGSFKIEGKSKTGGRRHAVGRERNDSGRQVMKERNSIMYRKNDEERALIAKALKDNTSLCSVVPIDEDRVQRMTDVARKENVAAGTELIKQGDLVADFFYIVQTGKFNYYKRAEEDSSQSELELVGATGDGGSFGELALLFSAPRAATVRAEVDSLVWIIDRTDFKNILMSDGIEQLDAYIKTLRALPVFKSVVDDNLKTVAESLVEITTSSGDHVITPPGAHYILHEGTVSMQISGKKGTVVPAPRYFGALALGQDNADSSLLVTSQTAKFLILDGATVELVQGWVKKLTPADMVKARVEEALRHKEPIYRNQLKTLGLLGSGAFGYVELCKKEGTEQTFAMKCLSKGRVVEQNLQKSVQNERDILFMLNSPFIVELYATYDGPSYIYLLLEPMMGGELYATYVKLGLYGKVPHARYYVAGVILAFEHCHNFQVLYRDLKPENLLLNEHGHLKVTDMGLAKMSVGKTYTTCGTPQYMAPEIIQSQGHTKAVDWWTLGILLFELMTGEPPFDANTPMKIFAKTMNGISKVTFNEKCAGSCEKLVKDLLKKKPTERLPMKPDGMRELKACPWYLGFDWEAFRSLRMEVPYKPQVGSQTDMSNFDALEAHRPKEVAYNGGDADFFTDFATFGDEPPKQAKRLSVQGKKSFTNSLSFFACGACHSASMPGEKASLLNGDLRNRSGSSLSTSVGTASPRSLR